MQKQSKLPTSILLRQLSGSQYANDIIELLQRLSDDAASVKNDIRGVTTLESRNAICNYLDDTIDTIRRISQNENRKRLGEYEMDDNI